MSNLSEASKNGDLTRVIALLEIMLTLQIIRTKLHYILRL